MKTFKVDIPDEQIAFITELFDLLGFLSYWEDKPDERSYLAKDYMINKGLISANNMADVKNLEEKKLGQMNDLKQAIENLQNKRQSETIKYLNFRLPTSIKNGIATDIKQFSNEEELQKHLESYFRISIDKINYKPNKTKAVEMDNYEVIAIVKESGNNHTSIKAGFSDIAFNL